MIKDRELDRAALLPPGVSEEERLHSARESRRRWDATIAKPFGPENVVKFLTIFTMMMN